MRYSRHFEDMLKERCISAEWVDQTVTQPEKVEELNDGTRHFLRRIPEQGNRWLRVVVNVRVSPNMAVTAFFDRRLRGAR